MINVETKTFQAQLFPAFSTRASSSGNSTDSSLLQPTPPLHSTVTIQAPRQPSSSSLHLRPTSLSSGPALPSSQVQQQLRAKLCVLPPTSIAHRHIPSLTHLCRDTSSSRPPALALEWRDPGTWICSSFYFILCFFSLSALLPSTTVPSLRLNSNCRASSGTSSTFHRQNPTSKKPRACA